MGMVHGNWTPSPLSRRASPKAPASPAEDVQGLSSVGESSNAWKASGLVTRWRGGATEDKAAKKAKKKAKKVPKVVAPKIEVSATSAAAAAAPQDDIVAPVLLQVTIYTPNFYFIFLLDSSRGGPCNDLALFLSLPFRSGAHLPFLRSKS